MIYLIFSLLSLFNLLVLIRIYISNQKLRRKLNILNSIVFYLSAYGKVDKYDLVMAREQALNDLDSKKQKK